MTHIARGVTARNLRLSTLAAVVELWRRDLAIKVQRARTRMELIGLDESEQEELAREVAEFKRLRKAISWFQEVA